MRHSLGIGAAIAVALGAVGGHAEDKGPKLSAAFGACMDRAAGVDPAMWSCQTAEHDRQDARLNADYKALMARLSPGQQSDLRTRERAWIKRAKAKCDHAGDAEAGGTLQSTEVAQCYIDETAHRANALER